MVESVKVKPEGSVFSIKKDTILPDLIPHIKLPHESLFAKIDEQIVERKRKKTGDRPHFFTFFLRHGDSVDLQRF